MLSKSYAHDLLKVRVDTLEWPTYHSGVSTTGSLSTRTRERTVAQRAHSVHTAPVAALNEQERRHLGAQVVKSRRVRSWSQDELSHEAGITRRTVSSIERGHKVAEASLRAIELALGWSTDLAEDIARGLSPNPDAPTPQAIVKPIAETEAIRLSDDEWNRSIVDALNLMEWMKKGLPDGEPLAKQLMDQMIKAAEQRGNTGVADMLRSVR